MTTTGGWIQLNVLPSPVWEIGAGAGLDDPDDSDLDVATQRLRNLAVEGHASWRRAPVVVGFEIRRLETRYGASLTDSARPTSIWRWGSSSRRVTIARRWRAERARGLVRAAVGSGTGEAGRRPVR